MRHQKRSHRYEARNFTREATQQGVELPEKLDDAVRLFKARKPIDPYADLPTLDLHYGLSRHMRDMNLDRKWQVVGNTVIPRNHGPSVHERVREANRYQALRNLVAEAKEARKGR